MECPYINNDFAECSQTLNIQNLGGAYGLCNGRYQQCPVYRELREGHLANSEVAFSGSCVETRANSLVHNSL